MAKEKNGLFGEISEPQEKELKKYRGKYRNQLDISVETLRALRDGQESAFNEVYARFASPLKDFLSALIQNEEDAEELNHEVFVSLWTSCEKIVPEKGIKGFLFMRAKNMAMNYFDHKKVKEKYVDFCSRNTDYEFAPDEHLIGGETKILIDLALKAMPEKKRVAFRMKYEEGKSVEQIASELGLGQSTVRNYLSSAVRSLKEIVAIYVIFFLS